MNAVACLGIRSGGEASFEIFFRMPITPARQLAINVGDISGTAISIVQRGFDPMTRSVFALGLQGIVPHLDVLAGLLIGARRSILRRTGKNHDSCQNYENGLNQVHISFLTETPLARVYLAASNLAQNFLLTVKDNRVELSWVNR